MQMHTPTSAFVAQALAPCLIEAHGQIPDGFHRIWTDTRTLQPGDLFVAIRGERFDGHDFIPHAIAAGAAGLLVEAARAHRVPAHYTGVVYRADSTQFAYGLLGAQWRKRYYLPVIAIGGSVGKTTTKEMLAAIAEQRYPERVLKTRGSENGWLGIPMTLLRLQPDHALAIVEIGIDEIGAMRQHVDTVAPTHALLTAIGPEHLEKLHDLPTVAYEESLLLTETHARGGIIALNLDDPWIVPLHDRLVASNTLCFTLNRGAVAAGADTLGGVLEDGVLTLWGMGIDGLAVRMPLPGIHNARNALAATAMARELGIPPEQIAQGLEAFRPAFGRSESSVLPDGTFVYRDYYNANPVSVRAALTVLRQHPGGTLWICLADMLELGEEEERYHRELAKDLLDLHEPRVLLCGERMLWLHDELRRRGLGARTLHFLGREELAAYLAAHALPGDRILIKGSRSQRMEEVWARFAAARGLAEGSGIGFTPPPAPPSRTPRDP